MAGYIMSLDNIDALQYCIESGTYSTKMNIKNIWNKQQEGTFADYFSMKEGDNIYFFIQRKIYGIGKIVNVGFDCKYLNFIDADIARSFSTNEMRVNQQLLSGSTDSNRCFCTFKPTPYFFRRGVDMDEVLSSNPSKFRMLRAMWKVSFIKVSDDENQAIVDIILKRNEEYIENGRNTFIYDDTVHDYILNHVTQSHCLGPEKILSACEEVNEKLKHEMAIEAALCYLLSNENHPIFGSWDYISHQVIASPFKAIDYMDKMDIFGYRYIFGYKTISKYLVIEIKKDRAECEVIDQIMKYVDWIQKEYAFGDYSMIQAYIVAADYTEEVIEKRNREGVRNFTKGYRPTNSCIWNDIKLLRYRYNGTYIDFEEIN